MKDRPIKAEVWICLHTGTSEA